MLEASFLSSLTLGHLGDDVWEEQDSRYACRRRHLGAASFLGLIFRPRGERKAPPHPVALPVPQRWWLSPCQAEPRLPSLRDTAGDRGFTGALREEDS